MTKRIETTMEIERDGIGEVTIEGDYTAPKAGVFYDRHGDPGDPPEPAYVDNLRAFKDGSEVKLAESEFETAYEKICEVASQ